MLNAWNNKPTKRKSELFYYSVVCANVCVLFCTHEPYIISMVIWVRVVMFSIRALLLNALVSVSCVYKSASIETHGERRTHAHKHQFHLCDQHIHAHTHANTNMYRYCCCCCCCRKCSVFCYRNGHDATGDDDDFTYVTCKRTSFVYALVLAPRVCLPGYITIITFLRMCVWSCAYNSLALRVHDFSCISGVANR